MPVEDFSVGVDIDPFSVELVLSPVPEIDIALGVGVDPAAVSQFVVGNLPEVVGLVGVVDLHQVRQILQGLDKLVFPKIVGPEDFVLDRWRLRPKRHTLLINAINLGTYRMITSQLNWNLLAFFLSLLRLFLLSSLAVAFVGLIRKRRVSEEGFDDGIVLFMVQKVGGEFLDEIEVEILNSHFGGVVLFGKTCGGFQQKFLGLVAYFFLSFSACKVTLHEHFRQEIWILFDRNGAVA
jgi:hypothetical protein